MLSDHIRRMADKCSRADITNPSEAYPLIDDLIYGLQLVASELPSKEQWASLEMNKERERFEKWADKETCIMCISRSRTDPDTYEKYEVELAWQAWRRSRTFSTEE